MQPGKYSFDVYQGSTFNYTLTYKSNDNLVNLTGYTARMQVRKSVNDTTTLLSLTSGNQITLGGTAGTINILINATTMANIPYGKWVYDLELVDTNGAVNKLLAGSFIVRAEVTR